MFSKFFKSAKTALQPPTPENLQYPETDLFPPTPAPKTPARDMATTGNRRDRIRAVLDSDAEITTPSAQILASSRKRRLRDLTSTPATSQDIPKAEPSSSTKKPKLTARSKDSPVVEAHSHSEVQLSMKEVIDLDSAEEGTENKQAASPSKRRRLPRVDDDAKAEEQQRKIIETGKSPGKNSTAISLLSDDDEELEPKASSQKILSLLSDDEEELEPKASSQQILSLLSDEEVEVPKSRETRSPVKQPKSVKRVGSAEKSNNAKKDAPLKIEEKPAMENIQLPKSKHHRFGSKEPVVEIPSSDPIDNDDIEEASSSDDEAPEEVGTREAAEDAKKVVRAAAKAVEQLRATERKARQERDLALKKQAELNKKRKRKHVTEELAPEVEENRLSEDLASKDAVTTVDVEQAEVDDAAMNDAPDMTEQLDHPPPTKKSKTQKIDEHNLPDLLPPEYLEDIPDEPSISPTESIQPRPKKTKFHDLVEKKAKDKKKGSTMYRVRESEQNPRLAPKASKDSMSLKEAWLSGGVKKNGRDGSLRKPMKNSFFVNGKSGAGKR